MNHFHIEKLSKWHIKMNRYQRWRPKIPDITSLRRLKDVSLIYVPLKRLCDVLSWSVSRRYQLVRRYDVSNWSVLFTYQGDVTKTSQIGLPNWRSSCDVMMISQHGTGLSNKSLNWVNFFGIMQYTFSACFVVQSL